MSIIMIEFDINVVMMLLLQYMTPKLHVSQVILSGTVLIIICININ